MPVRQHLKHLLTLPWNRVRHSDVPGLFGDPERLATLARELGIFSRLSERQVRRLTRLFIPRHYAKGDLIIRKGEVGLGMFILTAGSLEVFHNENGKERSVAVIEPGQVVGEMSLIDSQPRSMNVKALEAADCLLVTRDSFEGLVKREPEVLWGIVPILVERLRDSDRMLTERLASIESDRLPLTSAGVETPAVDTPKPLTETQDASTARKANDSRQAATSDKDGDGESPQGLIASFFQLFSASFLLASSAGLLGVQEALRLVVGRGAMRVRLNESETVVSAIASTVEERMDASSHRVFHSFRTLLQSLLSVFDL